MIALRPVRTVPPAETLLGLADAKEHLRVDGDDSDAYVASLVATAEQHLDGYAGIAGRALVTQTWAQSLDGFPCGAWLRRAPRIRLPLGPLQSVSSVTYYDTAGISQTFDAANYHAVSDAIGPCIVLADTATWPNTAIRPDAVTVTWVCGYGSLAAVPAPFIHAAKLIVGDLYANRELGPVIRDRVDALLEPLRAGGF